MQKHQSSFRSPKIAALACGVLLAVSACGSDSTEDASSTTTASASDTTEAEVTAEAEAATTTANDATAIDVVTECDEIAPLFVTKGSANPDLSDPEVAASCEGDTIVITSNGIPDFTYIETSPGSPRDGDYTWTIPASPTLADATTDIPYIGPMGVTLGGIPIYGPTEGTGGDVDSLPGIVSVCGSHNGPTGFHTHKIGTSSETDCFFTPEEVAAEPQLVGYAFDGFPIYTGIDQYTSSWELTDETLFATDTWAAHSYVEGSGDLDECNGRVDDDGNYAYFTTEAFPYIMGCFAGEVEIEAAGGGGGGDEGRPERPEGEDGEEPPAEGDEERPEPPADGDEGRPERPEDGDEERPEPPADGDEDRPERPEPPADEDN